MWVIKKNSKEYILRKIYDNSGPETQKVAKDDLENNASVDIDKQHCSYQGKALNVPTAFSGLSSSSNIKKLNIRKKNEKFFFLKFEIFL